MSNAENLRARASKAIAVMALLAGRSTATCHQVTMDEPLMLLRTFENGSNPTVAPQ